MQTIPSQTTHSTIHCITAAPEAVLRRGRAKLWEGLAPGWSRGHRGTGYELNRPQFGPGRPFGPSASGPAGSLWEGGQAGSLAEEVGGCCDGVAMALSPPSGRRFAVVHACTCNPGNLRRSHVPSPPRSPSHMALHQVQIAVISTATLGSAAWDGRWRVQRRGGGAGGGSVDGPWVRGRRGSRPAGGSSK